MSRFARKEKAPEQFEIIEPTLTALETELREKVNEPHEGKRKGESLWPVHQITWQKSRYVYDMHYKYGLIDKAVVDYCIRTKMVDGSLMAKWKKVGYERLCSTYVINTSNYKFGTVSICRVPRQYLTPGTPVEDPNTGCHGCASGPGGCRNIFGNKYGQYLAAIQVARMRRRGELDEQGRLRDRFHGREGDDSDEEGSDDEAKGEETIWAANADEAALGPGEEGEASGEAEKEARKALGRMGGPPGAGPPQGKRQRT